ncbi:MAG: vitamin K epoxide reductase family protein [Myxococcota bacterium]
MRQRMTWAAAMVVGLLCSGGAWAQQPVARGVMFFAPGCGHCHEVMTNHLPPLARQHGERLQIAFVNVATSQGGDLYKAVVDHFKLPREQQGFPAFVIGDRVLVGSLDIPKQLPGLVQRHLANSGGVDWPRAPGLAVAAAELVANAERRAAALHKEQKLTAWQRFRLDPMGNGLAVVVLSGMVLVVAWVKLRLWRAWRSPEQLPAGTMMSPWPWRAVGVLAAVGLGVAAYMAYVESAEVAAVCGPVGDCNAVQQSPYAKLFGVPLGILGMLGYVAILFLWGWGALRAFASTTSVGKNKPPQGALPVWLLFGVASFGTAFSMYLTFLEPFVIGATCAWCLTSAVIMTAVFALSSFPCRRLLAASSHKNS